MHRHSRIHEKNGINVPKASPPVRKLSESKGGKKDFGFDKMPVGGVPVGGVPVVPGVPGVAGAVQSPSPFQTMVAEYSNKLDIMKNRQEQNRSAEFLQQYYSK